MNPQDQQKNDEVLRPAHDSGEPRDYFYRGFVSYSTEPDYDLARTVESFIESFHLRSGIRRLRLERLEICRDGSDFKLPSRQGEQLLGPGSRIRSILDGYLDQSMYLIVLCSRRAATSPYVKYEIEHFLQSHPSDDVLTVITEGESPSQKPEEVLPQELIAAGILERPWYDLREQRARKSPNWRGVRDFEEELVRLAAHLHGDSAGRIYPAWQRAEERKRKLRMASALFAALLVMGALGAYLWTRTDRYLMTRIYREAPPLSNLADLYFSRNYLPALTCSSSAQNALLAAERTSRYRSDGLAAIATVLAKSDRPQAALEITRQLAAIADKPRADAPDTPEYAIGQVAVALAQAHHTEEALEAIERITSLRGRADFLAQVAFIAKLGIKGPRFSGIVDRTIQEMKQKDAPEPFDEWGELAAALASAGRVDEARGIAAQLERMAPSSAKGDPYNVTQYLTQLTSAAAVPELKTEVLPIARAAIEAALRIPSGADQWQYVTRLAGAYARLGVPEGAVILANLIAHAEETLDRDDALSRIGQALSTSHDFDQALKVLRLAKASTSADALVELARQLPAVEEPGPIIDAVIELESIRFKDTRAYDLSRFAEALAEVRMMPAALRVADTGSSIARQVTHEGEKAYTLAFLAQAYAAAAPTAEARRCFDEAAGTVAREFNAESKSVVFLSLAEALCRLHAYHEAYDYANRCWRPQDKTEAYAAILRAYAVNRNAKLSTACGP
jgi:tetratricopeptide (TPR) repeat protein